MESKRHLLSGDVVDTVAKATPEKRKRGKSMSRRSGQSGYIEVRGKYYVVRFWKDVRAKRNECMQAKRYARSLGLDA
jgi:hypothetical protein